MARNSEFYAAWAIIGGLKEGETQLVAPFMLMIAQGLLVTH